MPRSSSSSARRVGSGRPSSPGGARSLSAMLSSSPSLARYVSSDFPSFLTSPERRVGSGRPLSFGSGGGARSVSAMMPNYRPSATQLDASKMLEFHKYLLETNVLFKPIPQLQELKDYLANHIDPKTGMTTEVKALLTDLITHYDLILPQSAEATKMFLESNKMLVDNGLMDGATAMQKAGLLPLLQHGQVWGAKELKRPMVKGKNGKRVKAPMDYYSKGPKQSASDAILKLDGDTQAHRYSCPGLPVDVSYNDEFDGNKVKTIEDINRDDTILVRDGKGRYPTCSPVGGRTPAWLSDILKRENVNEQYVKEPQKWLDRVIQSGVRA